MRKVIIAALAIGALVTATDADAKFVSVTLAPSASITKYQQKSAHAVSSCGIFACGLGGLYGSCELGSYELPRVGYQNVYNAGSKPCNCWSWQACTWRPFVAFDFSTLPSKTVVESRLHFKAYAHQFEGNIATNAPTCTIRLYVAQTAWNKYAIPGDLIATFKPGITTASSVINLQIGGLVRQWVNGQLANSGLFFVGSNEKLASDSNDRCYVELTELSLEVTVNVK
jgi:hypothetical protein